MKTVQGLTGSCVALTVLIGLGGCSGMSRQEQNTAVGAGVGAVAGAALTDGHPAGVVGGAIVGGLIGHGVGGNDSYRNRDGDWDRDRNRDGYWDGDRGYNN